MSTVEVTHLYCPKSGAPMGADNTTHHLVPTGPSAERVMRCRYCGETEAALRATAELPIHEQIRKMTRTLRRSAASVLLVGDVVRVDGKRYRVSARMTPTRSDSDFLALDGYSEDGQFDTVYLRRDALVAVVGRIED